jgi:hypothetical protein
MSSIRLEDGELAFIAVKERDVRKDEEELPITLKASCGRLFFKLGKDRNVEFMPLADVLEVFEDYQRKVNYGD